MLLTAAAKHVAAGISSNVRLEAFRAQKSGREPDFGTRLEVGLVKCAPEFSYETQTWHDPRDHETVIPRPEAATHLQASVIPRSREFNSAVSDGRVDPLREGKRLRSDYFPIPDIYSRQETLYDLSRITAARQKVQQAGRSSNMVVRKSDIRPSAALSSSRRSVTVSKCKSGDYAVRVNEVASDTGPATMTESDIADVKSRALKDMLDNYDTLGDLERAYSVVLTTLFGRDSGVVDDVVEATAG